MPSINDKKYRAKIDEILAAYSGNIAADIKILADEALKNIKNGLPVTKAIDKALKDTGFFLANNAATVNAVYMAACSGYGILPEIVADPVGIKTKLLSESWTGDGMKLSSRLHGVNKQMRTDIIDTVSSSMRRQKTCVEAARELYTGYDRGTKGGEEYSRYQPSGKEVREKVITGKDTMSKSPLPKYLDDLKTTAKSVTQGDAKSYEKFCAALDKAELQISKLARNGTPTLAQKSGYNLMLEASKALGNNTMDPKKLDALQRKFKKQGLGAVGDLNQAIFDMNNKALDKAVKMAIEERSRYHAERIARTESSRAWFDGFIADNHDNPDIAGYRWVLSSRHQQLPFDQCDLYNDADMGLGKGIYLKDKLPAIPVHPHCLCSLVKVYDGELPSDATFDHMKADKYIVNLSDEQQIKLFGLEGMKKYQNGADWQDVLKGWNGFSSPKPRLTANDFKVSNRIPEGTYNLQIRNQAQKRHSEGSKEFNHYLDQISTLGLKPSKIAFPSPQELVNKYHGKGVAEINALDGSIREKVLTNEVIGQYWNNKKKQYVDTKAFRIVYSKKGTHIFPVWDGTKE